MSEDSDSDFEDEDEVEGMFEAGFGEVEFKEIKIGFEDDHEAEELKEDLTDEDLSEFLALGFLADAFEIDHVRGLSLEETLFGIVREDRGSDNNPGRESLSAGDFYKAEIDVENFYENDVYVVSSEGETERRELRDDYEGFVEMDDVNTLVRAYPNQETRTSARQEPSRDIFVESEIERQRDRSVLEISGFWDEEAEKRRKKKRERFW